MTSERNEGVERGLNACVACVLQRREAENGRAKFSRLQKKRKLAEEEEKKRGRVNTWGGDLFKNKIY